MAQSIREVMMADPLCLPAVTAVGAAAKAMRDAGIGDVIVQEEGQIQGIVTDRDIIVRVVAEDQSPNAMAIGEMCSQELTTLSPEDLVDDAVGLMRDKALRRLPVVDDSGRPVGIVTLGDLALERDPDSTLAAISAAAPNN